MEGIRGRESNRQEFSANNKLQRTLKCDDLRTIDLGFPPAMLLWLVNSN